MKTLLFALLFLSFTVKAQSTLDDANTLNELLATPSDINRNNKIIDLLKKYNIICDATNGVPSATNPFIAKYVNNTSLTTNSGTALVLASPTGGFLNPTVIADGLGAFIAKRMREELTLKYIDEFRNKIKENADLKALFPVTFDALLTVDPFEYSPYLSTMRDAFYEDYKVLPANSIALLETKIDKIDITNAVTKTTDPGKTINAKIALATGLCFADIAFQMNKEVKVAKIFSQLDTNTYISKNPSIDIQGALRFASIISRHLADNNNNWYSSSQIKGTLLSNPKILQLFIGLILGIEEDKLNATEFNIGGTNTKLYNLMVAPEGSNVFFKTESYLNNILPKLDNLASRINELKNLRIASRADIPTTYIINVSDASVELLISLTDLTRLGGNLGNIKIPTVNENLLRAREVIQIVRHIDSKQYGLALLRTVTFIEQNTNNIIGDETKAIIAKYGNFMATIIGAKNSEEGVAALEAAALPVQSYRIKRTSTFNLAINAYGGIFGAYESRNGKTISSLSNNGNGFTWGLSAPVGLSASFGGSKGTSVGFFFPLIDVGAITAIRIQNNTSTLPELDWQNILAPGAYFTIGFKNSPLALSIGAQNGPQLRSYTISTPTTNSTGTQTLVDNVEKFSSWRFGLSLAVDIPIFNLWTVK